MESKDFFFFVYDELIRKRMFEKTPFDCDGNYSIVRANLGRLSYKTSYIVEKASDEDIIITGSRAMANEMKRELRLRGKGNIPVITHDDEVYFRGRRQSYNIVWLDECNRNVLNILYTCVHPKLTSMVVAMGDF